MPAVLDRPNPCYKPFLRRVKGNRVQARVYLSAGWGHVNLGLFGTEYAASRAVTEVLKRVTEPTPLGVWRATLPVVAAGLMRAVVPKWVRRVPGGYAPGWRVRGVPAGVYACPERCHRAAALAVGGRPVPEDLWPDDRLRVREAERAARERMRAAGVMLAAARRELRGLVAPRRPGPTLFDGL